MIKIPVLAAIVCLGLSFNAGAAEISAEALQLTPGQNQKLREMKENLKAEVQPIWEEVESGRQRIVEIEKKYFGEFWNMLTDEQKQEFARLNQGEMRRYATGGRTTVMKPLSRQRSKGNKKAAGFVPA